MDIYSVMTKYKRMIYQVMQQMGINKVYWDDAFSDFITHLIAKNILSKFDPERSKEITFLHWVAHNFFYTLRVQHNRNPVCVAVGLDSMVVQGELIPSKHMATPNYTKEAKKLSATEKRIIIKQYSKYLRKFAPWAKGTGIVLNERHFTPSYEAYLRLKYRFGYSNSQIAGFWKMEEHEVKTHQIEMIEILQQYSNGIKL